MMQQPVYQQEHQGAQDQGQQMVLCPVRLVYETQMLVQPGEQIQPNQTILINHQNTPPWIQNRQVQNQVIYVQHVPTNYIPSHQQHIDQNQLYIQNYGYQNVPQMFVQNPQEQIRPMQMQMMPNMVQNMQTLPTNINAIQNQRMISNVAPVQQQVNIVNTPNQNNTINRLIAPSHINQNEVINKPQELHTQSIFRHQMPQTVQQEHRFPIQPTITMVPNNVQSIQRVPQAYDSNVSQIRPVHQNIAPNIQQAYPNTIFNVDDTKKVNSVNTTANKGTNVTSFNIVNPNTTSKSLPQTYRPIQPRTNQVRNNTPNLHPMQTSVGIQAQHTMPNIISMNNVPRKIMPNSSTLVSSVNTTLSNIKVESNNFLFNRKRKSESPDEVHKKVANNNQTEAPIVIKQIQNEAYNMNNSADVGVNTSPIHRPSGRITINNMQITPLNPNAHNSKLIEELAKPVRNQAQNTQVTEAQNVVRNTVSVMPENVADMVPSDKEKLVRNTVYVQARGRILTDKDNIPEPPKIETPVCNPEPKLTLPTVKPKIETIVKNPEPNISMPVLNEKQPETSQEISQLKPEIKTELINAEVKQSATHEVKPLAKVEIKQPPKVEVIPPVEVKPPAKVEVIPPAKIEVKLPVKLEVKSPTKAEIKTPAKVEVKSSAKVEVKPPVKIEVKPPAKTELKPPAKVELKPPAKAEVKPPAKAEVKTPAKVENNKSKTKLELKQEKSGNTLVEPPKKEVVKMDTESVPDVKPKEDIPTEVKEDRGFILTHVLGGFVIQESNIAFPIRKPLKEKTLFNNTEDLKNDAKDMKREFVKDNSKILDISHLNIKECESMVADTDESQTSDDKENPFSQLKPSEVRTWTAEQLATHLAKYNWTETVSVLQDHELDGESLLLVSKAQLVTIGVKEEHAEAICEFVKS